MTSLGALPPVSWGNPAATGDESLKRHGILRLTYETATYAVLTRQALGQKSKPGSNDKEAQDSSNEEEEEEEEEEEDEKEEEDGEEDEELDEPGAKKRRASVQATLLLAKEIRSTKDEAFREELRHRVLCGTRLFL